MKPSLIDDTGLPLSHLNTDPSGFCMGLKLPCNVFRNVPVMGIYRQSPFLQSLTVSKLFLKSISSQISLSNSENRIPVCAAIRTIGRNLELQYFNRMVSSRLMVAGFKRVFFTLLRFFCRVFWYRSMSAYVIEDIAPPPENLIFLRFRMVSSDLYSLKAHPSTNREKPVIFVVTPAYVTISTYNTMKHEHYAF